MCLAATRALRPVGVAAGVVDLRHERLGQAPLVPDLLVVATAPPMTPDDLLSSTQQ